MPQGLAVPEGALKLGIRPEYLQVSAVAEPGTLAAVVRQVQDVGTYQMVTCDAVGVVLKLRLTPQAQAPQVGAQVFLHVLGPHTCFYKNEELVA